MTVLKRRTRDSRTEAVEANGGGTALAVAAFEYVQVEDTALVRLTGTWSGDRGHPMDMALVASRSSGEQQSFPAHASAGSRIHLEGALWEVAFSVPTGLAESRLWKFSLRAGSETIELPPPRQHRAPAGAVEPDPPSEEGEVDPDARVRQAEAAISWIERQLTRERDARRAAEQELAKARPELEARRRELEHVAALELQAAHLAEERKRRTELEAQLKEVEGRLHELSREHNFNEQLKVELGELAKERDRLLPLHDRVEELTAERDKLAAERDRRSELEARLEELAAQRDRLVPFEAQVEEMAAEVERLTVDRDRLATFEQQVGQLEAERERRLELEVQIGELAAQRDRLLPLEARTDELAARVDALAAERDRLLPLESEIEELRIEREGFAARIEELSAERQRAADQVQEFVAERDRLLPLEARVADLTAELDRLRSSETGAVDASKEHSPEQILEQRMLQAVEHGRITALEQWVADLRHALADARGELQASETDRTQLRAELSRVRANAESTQARLAEELAEARSGREIAPPGSSQATSGDSPTTDEGPKPEAHVDDVTRVLFSDASEESADATPADEARAEPDPRATGERIPCGACDAMGSCRRCGGRGKRFGRSCANCNGTGTCSACGGPGYVWVEEGAGERT